MTQLDRRFFQQDVMSCTRKLIGCELVWRGCSGTIIETEAYAEFGDLACHAATRPSTRAFIERQPEGSSYVYLNYGIHWMLNVLAKSDSGTGTGLVLIRALRPTAGIPAMRERRSRQRKSAPPADDRWLCSGPGKLAAALGITGQDDSLDFCAEEGIGIYAPEVPFAETVIATPRIGISQAKDFPWRFVVENDPYASKP